MKSLETKKGQTISYTEIGAGEPVLFVHGSFATASAWRGLISELDDDQFRSIALDLPGCGATTSPSPEGSLLEQEVQTVETVASTISNEPVHLVGHSYGGVICLAASFAKNISIRSLTLFERLPLTLLQETGDSEALGEIKNFVADYQTAFEAGEHWAFSRVINLWGGDNAFNNLPTKIREAMAPATAINLRQWRDNLALKSSTDEYRTLTVPTTLVAGQHTHPTARLMVERLSELIPSNNVIEILGAGHFMTHSHPRECANALIGQKKDGESI